MLSIPLCGVGPQNPCRITLLAKFTPHNSRAGRSVAWPRGGCRKPRQGAGVASRIPRDPASDSGPRPGQLVAAARHAVCLAGPPVPARSPCGPARCGIGRPRIPLARNCRMPVGRLGLVPKEAPEQRLAKRAKNLDLVMNPVVTASLPRMPASAAKRTLGRPGHRVGEESSDRHARRARRTRADAASPEPPSCSLRGRCGDDQVGARAVGLGPARGSGAVDLETERAAVRQAGTPTASARRNLRWARVPLVGPALWLCGVNFAKSVMRQGFCGPTPHNGILNITAGANSCQAGFAPAEAQCLFTAHAYLVLSTLRRIHPADEAVRAS